jgi:hypothetical protein
MRLATLLVKSEPEPILRSIITVDRRGNHGTNPAKVSTMIAWSQCILLAARNEQPQAHPATFPCFSCVPWSKKWIRNIGVGTIPTVLPNGGIDLFSRGLIFPEKPTQSRFLGNPFY